jgi:hypothetical protein
MRNTATGWVFTLGLLIGLMIGGAAAYAYRDSGRQVIFAEPAAKLK